MAKENLNVAGFDNDQLVSELSSMERELVNMRFDHAVKGLGNPMEIRDVRRNIARLNTEMRSRELAVMSPEDVANRSKRRARRSRK